MIRSTYRNLMLIILVACIGIALYLFRMAQDNQTRISERQNDITRLNQELENAQSLNVALTELDNLTITEQTATQLDILRHLGLEQTAIDFQLESREVQAVGNTSLYTHNVRINANMPYDQALALCDRLQNTKKIILNMVEINAPNTDNNNVNMTLTGKIYGLDKVLNATGTAPLESPAADPLAQPQAAEVSTTFTAISPSIISPSLDISGAVPAPVPPLPTPSATELPR